MELLRSPQSATGRGAHIESMVRVRSQTRAHRIRSREAMTGDDAPAGNVGRMEDTTSKPHGLNLENRIGSDKSICRPVPQLRFDSPRQLRLGS